MPIFSGRERLIFGAFLVCAALLAADRWILMPAWNHWSELNQSVVHQQAKLDRRQRLLHEADRLRKEYSSFTGLRSRGAAPVGKATMTTLLRDIEKSARQNGLKVSDVKPEAMTAGQPARAGSVFFSIATNWESLMRFLYDLQTSPRGLRIMKASLTRKGGETDPSIIIGQLVVADSHGE